MGFSCFCVECVDTGTVGVLERFGQYQRALPAGFNVVGWPVEYLAGRLSLRVQQLEVGCQTKTKDNVFVTLVVVIQYQVYFERAFDAFYRLSEPGVQIRAHVEDIVRSKVPTMELDHTFETKEEIAHSIRDNLRDTMTSYGYEILQALVVDIKVDDRVKMAMNEINASRRLKEAAAEKAEAEKIIQVKAAEASAESKYLNGLGIARERKAIVDGLRGSVEVFSHEVVGATPKDVMDLILLTQYFDTLKDIGVNPNSTTIFLQHGPSAVSELQQQLKEGIMQHATMHRA